MVTKFDRALDPAFIAALAIEAEKKTWWFDVLSDPKLLIALRGSYLKVYWRGQSLFCASSQKPEFDQAVAGGIKTGVKATTHEKYLVDPELASQVSLADRVFDIASLVDKGFIRSYEGPLTLAKMKKAAGLFSGLEKTGCHEIAVLNSAVIDVEIAFPGKVSLDDGGKDKQAPRVDLVSLESFDDEARLVFWEAKHYSNGELRAENGSPAVLRQVKIYKKYLSENRKAIEHSYKKVAEDLVSISNMGWKRQLSPLINDVGTGKLGLTLGAEPKVGLIIFGFDSAQRDHGWRGHRERLNEIGDICAVGEAKKVRLPT
jgi:hypothetical protein